MSKQCSKCLNMFPVSVKYFNRNSRSKDYLQGVCRTCQKEYWRNFISSNPGFDTYRHIKDRCEKKSHTSYPFYGAKGIKVKITVSELNKLWMRDKAYNLARPSIDRKNPKGNYTFNNCRYIELSQNVARRFKTASK